MSPRELEHVKSMLQKADERLKATQVLIDNSLWEDATSRAYYAAFHAISAVLYFHGFEYKSHGQAIGSFNKNFVNTGQFPQEYGQRLSKMFLDRQVADYRTESEIDKKAACEDYKIAKEIVETCRQFIEIS